MDPGESPGWKDFRSYEWGGCNPERGNAISAAYIKAAGGVTLTLWRSGKRIVSPRPAAFLPSLIVVLSATTGARFVQLF